MIVRDIAFAVRGLRRAPGFTTLALLTLVIGIGDGRQIVVVGDTGIDASLWVWEIGASEPRLLPGTEGAYGPFFSPESGSRDMEIN